MSNKFNIELISNLYITFYFNKINKNTKKSFTNYSLDTILNSLNKNEEIHLEYSIDTIDQFTTFLNKIFNKHLNMFNKEERLNICILNNILINPSLI